MRTGRIASANLRALYQKILSYTGLILFLSGLLMLVPIIVIFFRPLELTYIRGFIIPSLLLSIIGYLMWKLFKRAESVILTVQEGRVIVLISWIIVMIFSAWPFMTIMKLNFTQSLFESVSGWTTTGLTVIDESKAPHLILLWRSLMQLAGGAGLAIIMLAAIAGPMGPGLSVAEGRREQLVPHVRESARKVTGIYLGYVIAGIIAYWLAGMGLFDAVNHTFTSVSTGGFSTHPESIGYWDSIAVEAISIPIMILGSLTF